MTDGWVVVSRDRSRTSRPFDRHDLEWSRGFLGRLRAKGRYRRWGFDDGKYDSGHPNRYYGVCSTAMENLNCYMSYRHVGLGVLLDAGCGESADADIALLTGYHKAYAVDLLPPLNPFTKFRAIFMLGDVCERLPIRAHSVDAIVSNFVIPLMSKEDRLLFYAEAHRLLKPKGVMSIAAGPLSSGYGHDDTEPGFANSCFMLRKECRRLQEAGFKIARRYADGIIVTKEAT